MSTGRIPENIIDEVLSRADIVELISGYIPLKRAGRNFRACCPFHHEKTPSFMISPDRQIYHCFGCGKGGNAFNFLMQYEHMEFPEAVEVLAKKSGVILPEKQKQDDGTSGFITQLYKVNELAAAFYENNLNSAPAKGAKDYLLKRGLSLDSLKLFKLGFAEDKWDALINFLRQKNIPLSLLEKAGLIVPKRSGGYHDLFHSRIIMPIFDVKARVIAFGGRVVSPDTGPAADGPKYFNSPETPVYVKGKNLYGLNFSKEAIRQNDCVAVVEGYLDFIIPFQEGFKNIVASLGTALTYEQIRLIKRHTHNVVMVYDADTAGQAAMLRALDMFIEEGMNVKVASLPQGLDPDLLVRKNGAEAFRKIVAQAEGLFDYKLRALKARHNFKDIEAKALISLEMLSSIAKFKNAILKSEYLKKLSQELGVAEDSLWQELRNVKEDKPYFSAQAPQPKRELNINPAEKLLITMMLEEAELINKVKEILSPEDFQDGRMAKIVSLMFSLSESGRGVTANNLLNCVDDESASQIICELTLSPDLEALDHRKVADDCIRRIKQASLRIEKQKLQEQIKSAQHSGNENELGRLMREFHVLIKES